MDIFNLEATETTPSVVFNTAVGELLIEGRSIPENPGDFFEPLAEMLKKYYESPHKNTKINFKLEYINSGSSKFILVLLKLIAKANNEGKTSMVNWHYEEDDEAVFELGEHYKNSFDLPFNLIEFI